MKTLMAAFHAADRFSMTIIGIIQAGIWLVGWLLLIAIVIALAVTFPGLALIILIAFVVGKMTRLI